MRCAEVRSPFPGYTSAVGELAVRGARSLTREWIGDSGCLTGVAALGRTRPEGEPDVVEPSRHWDGAGLERKIRSAGRQWTVGDIAMVADGQWAIGARAGGGDHEAGWWSAGSPMGAAWS